MQRQTQWTRVSKTHKCPICERPDWCLLVGPPHNPDAVICARVHSDTKVGTKGAGWLHRLRNDEDWKPQRQQRRIQVQHSSVKPGIDFDILANRCYEALSPSRRADLAAELGVSLQSLDELRVGWDRQSHAYAFPMFDADRNCRGIRLRGRNGRKWSLTGGREGLFLPVHFSIYNSSPFEEERNTLLICEGATDAAALYCLGFTVVGRPSCRGGVPLILGLINRDCDARPREVVIVADDDRPGEEGAWDLAAVLVSYVPSVRIITPPLGIKDARQWKREGATRETVIGAINDAPALQIRIGVKAAIQ